MVLREVDLCGSEATSRTVLLVDQSSPDFFRRTLEGLPSITCISDFRNLYPFRKYSRSKSEVVQNGAEFCTFPPFVAEGPQSE